MIGEQGNDKRCGICGGHLRAGFATIPYVLKQTVVVVKNVPAEICENCHETFTSGAVTDRVLELLDRTRALHAEVSIIAYGMPPALEPGPASMG